jgi:U3 small nucleolar RNA-associated protein 14
MARKRGGRKASAANKGLNSGGNDGQATADATTKGRRGRSNSAASLEDVDDQIEYWKKKARNDGTPEKSDDEDIDDEEAFGSDDEKKWGSLFTGSKTKNKGVSKGKEKKAKIIEGESDIEDSSDSDNASANNNSGGEESDDSDGLEGSDDGEDSDSDADVDDNDGGQYMLDLLDNIDQNEKEAKERKKQAVISPNVAESEFSSAVLQNSKLSMEMLMKGIESDSKDYKKLQKDVAQLSGIKNRFDTSSTTLQTARTPASKVVSSRALRKVHYEDTRKDVSQWSGAIHQNRTAEALDFRSKESYNMQLSNAGLVGDFEPETDFEKEIANALEQAGASSEKEIIEKEKQKMLGINNGSGAFDAADDSDGDDDLGRKHMTVEEFQKRHGELSKMRALLFYEEQKARHINKIKSKKYRKIRKKQRSKMEQKELEAQLEEDPELARELEEKEELERMKERMTLAHKNTSKWAKQQLKRRRKNGASALDKDTRLALSAQLRTGEELRRKMKSLRGEDDDSDESDSDSEDGGDGTGTKKDKLVERARAVLKETSQKSEAEESGKGLFGMKFMQKGLEAQRNRAKEEARKLLEELEQNMRYEASDSDSDSDEDNMEVDIEPATKKAQKQVHTKVNVLDVMADGKLVANSLMFGKSNTVQVSGDIDVENGGEKGGPRSGAVTSTGHSVTLQVSSTDATMTTGGNKKVKNHVAAVPKTKQAAATNRSPNKRKAAEVANDDAPVDASSANPWMQAKSTNKKKKPKTKDSTEGAEEAVLNVNEAASAMLSNKNKRAKVSSKKQQASLALKESAAADSDDAGTDTKKKTNNNNNKSIVNMSQEELVRRAFAAPTDAELEEELEKEQVSLFLFMFNDGMRVHVSLQCLATF